MKLPKLFGKKKRDDEGDDFDEDDLEIADLEEMDLDDDTGTSAAPIRQDTEEPDILEEEVMVGGDDKLENPFDGVDGDDEFDDDDDDEEGEEDGSRRKAILFAVVGAVVLLSSAIGGLGWWYFSSDTPEAAKDDPNRIELAMPAPPGSLNATGGQSLNSMADGDGTQSMAMPAAANDAPSLPTTSEGAAPANNEATPPETAMAAPEAAPAISMNSLNSLGAQQTGDGIVVPAVVNAALARIPDQPTAADQSQALANAPIKALLEEKPGIGQLPKIANTGAQPWQVYARPIDPGVTLPRVAIMIEGIGLSRQASLAAINKLPPEISMVLSPYGRDLEDWVFRSRLAGHEVFMSVPMESEHFPMDDAGPLALDTQIQVAENQRRLDTVMASAGGYVGLVSFMGSRFMKAEGQIKKLLETVKDRGLMFVIGGNRTRNDAAPIAADMAVVRAESEFYLDDTPSIQTIRTNLDRAVSLAKDREVILVMARPYPVTISSILDWVKTIPDTGIILVPASAVATVPTAPQ